MYRIDSVVSLYTRPLYCHADSHGVYFSETVDRAGAAGLVLRDASARPGRPAPAPSQAHIADAAISETHNS